MAQASPVHPASHLSKAEAALASEFESVPRDVIHALVVRELHQYDSAKVRDFVPLLVAKSVRGRLREHGDTIQLP